MTDIRTFYVIDEGFGEDDPKLVALKAEVRTKTVRFIEQRDGGWPFRFRVTADIGDPLLSDTPEAAWQNYIARKHKGVRELETQLERSLSQISRAENAIRGLMPE